MRVFCCLLLLLNFSCSDLHTDPPSSCEPVIFDSAKFNSTHNFGANVVEYSLDDLCLYVKLGVSGCDDLHTIEMVSDGEIVYSDPPIMTFDFYDMNPQLCQAYFTFDMEYDLTPIKEKINGDIVVNFRNNDGSVKIEN